MNKNNVKVTWAQCVRDITIHASNKGILLPLFIGVIILILISKMSPEDSTLFINNVFNALCSYSLLGWLLFILSIILWGIFAKNARKRYSKYMEIVGKEKTKVQQKLNKEIKLSTSNRR